MERFNEKWELDADGCHIWTAAKIGQKDMLYGGFKVAGKLWRAHRWIFLQAHGYLPPMVCHACDKPLCVRERCLFPGTALDNHLDAMAKGRKPHNVPISYDLPEGMELLRL